MVCDGEADALAGGEAGGIEFDLEAAIGGVLDDAGVIAAGEGVEDFDAVRFRGVGFEVRGRAFQGRESNHEGPSVNVPGG